MASSQPNLRVLLDGDSSSAYREGDEVRGRVSLVLEQGEHIKSLKLRFFGECTSKTTRPIYVSGVDSRTVDNSRQEYEESVELFNLEQNILPNCNLPPSKHSWNFEFKFPTHTKPQFSRWAHGSKYAREPHPLPPTFKGYTDSPGGVATVVYQVVAELSLGSSKRTVEASEMLGYIPSAKDTPLEPQIRTRILYAQSWKPTSKDSKRDKDKFFKVPRSKQRASSSNTSTCTPRIVPTIHYPEKIAPGQHIPLLLSLNLTPENISVQPSCTLDSLTVTITTHTTSMCGQPRTQPEDSTTKHVPCISRSNINQALPFSTPIPLTSNFRLIDDAECVPTFTTYTITRRYTMTLVLGIRCAGHRFHISSTTPLVILPRIPAEQLRLLGVEEHGLGHGQEEEEVEPLPLYAPREPSKEFAPDYEVLDALGGFGYGAASVGGSVGSSRSASLAPSTAPTTPGLEIGEPVLMRADC